MQIDPTFNLEVDKTEQTREYKHYREAWEIRPRQFYAGQFPMHVDLELNTHCNLRCIMCFQDKKPLPVQNMGLILIKKLITECGKNGCYAMKFNHRGEPLLATHLTEAVRLAKEAGILDTMINTNATLLYSNKIKELIEAGLDRIICSIDSHIPHVYELIRVGAKFGDILTNICTLQGYKQLKGFKKPVCRVQMVKQELNKDHVENYIKYWSAIADQVAVEEEFDYGNTSDVDFNSEFSCPQPWQRLMVHADGEVYPCCSLTADSLGSIFKDTLKDLWNCNKMKMIRFYHKNKMSHELEMCRRCYMRKKEVNRK